MKIAVCIKQVPMSDKVKIDSTTHSLIRENAEMMMNPADLNALTEAIELKKRVNGTIDVFTMGADGAKNILYTALAMGADEAYLVTDRVFAGGDSLGTAKVLKKAIEKNGKYDLIVCGALASDGATSQVGPMMAELFGVPSVADVKKISDLENQKLSVYKSWKGKLAFIKVQLPALVTISLGCNTPILPTLRNQMKAKKKEIHYITNAELNINSEEIGFEGAKSLVINTYLRGQSGKHSEMISGSLEEVADKILTMIKEARG